MYPLKSELGFCFYQAKSDYCFFRIISIIETLTSLPSLFSNSSLPIETSFIDTFLSFRNFLRETSATSTPLEMNFPRALTVTSSAPFPNCIITPVT